jgi:hypothetical protein
MFDCNLCGGRHKKTSKIGIDHWNIMQMESNKPAENDAESFDEPNLESFDLKSEIAAQEEQDRVESEKGSSEAVTETRHEMKKKKREKADAAGENAVIALPVETDWKPNLKMRYMERVNSGGENISRFFTPLEELQFAKSIAIENGKKWGWLNERKRKKALKRYEDGEKIMVRGGKE